MEITMCKKYKITVKLDRMYLTCFASRFLGENSHAFNFYIMDFEQNVGVNPSISASMFSVTIKLIN